MLLGLAAGVLTQRTGGLEAAVALVVAHRVLLLALEAGGAVEPSQLRADLGAASVVPTLVSVLLVGALVEWQVRATRLTTRRRETPIPGAEGAGVAAPQQAVEGLPPARVRPGSPAYPGQISDDWGH